jgi:cytidylate kinase
MVGRDIGSKVLPNAAKVYLEASLDVRVQRRLAEVAGKATEAEVRENVLLRDRIDSQRAESPLVVAEDAIVVVTDDLDVQGVVEKIARVLGL